MTGGRPGEAVQVQLCTPAAEAAIGPDEHIPGGPSPNSVASYTLTYQAPIRYAGDATATVSVQPRLYLDQARYVVLTVPPGETGEPTVDLNCADRLEIPGEIDLVTSDGLFAETAVVSYVTRATGPTAVYTLIDPLSLQGAWASPEGSPAGILAVDAVWSSAGASGWLRAIEETGDEAPVSVDVARW